MPVESRRFVKAGLLWLLIGFLIGAALLAAKALGAATPPSLGIVHVHALFVGWLVNMVFGFALWMLPLNRVRYPQTQGRYSRGAVNWCFILLNAGLALRLIAEPVFDDRGRSLLLSAALLLSAVAQVAAVALFVVTVWTRVRAAAVRK